MTEPSPPPPIPPARPPWWRNEDWMAVALGAILIAIVLAVGTRSGLWAKPDFKWESAGDLAKRFSSGDILASARIGLPLWLLSTAGLAVLGSPRRRYHFDFGFPAVFLLAWLAQLAAGQQTMHRWGLEYVIFALLLGLLVSHTVRLPAWLREAARTEYYIKTGLVILGAEILFGEILKAGWLGMVQAVVVVAAVWRFGYWLARRLRVDDELAVMLSTAVSICGVSAAIAACGAIQGDRRKLSYVTSLVLIVAVPMIVLQPWLARALGMPELVAGAWIGGTLDTTGSVAAAGALVGERAMKLGTIVKLSQNVLIGVAAFVLSVWWTCRGGRGEGGRPGAGVIWERFPKFVLGFLAVSLLFSFALHPPKETLDALKGLRTVWFALAFVSIGLETRFADLVKLEGGRPALAFVGAQAFNVVWTLLLAWLLFGGVLLEAPMLN